MSSTNLYVLLRMRIDISGVKADLRKLFPCLESEASSQDKLVAFEEFIDKNKNHTWFGFNNSKWRDDEDHEYHDGQTGKIDIVNHVVEHNFIGKYLVVKIDTPNCKPTYSPHFVPLVYFFSGNFGEYTELKIYAPGMTDSTKVVFDYEGTIVAGTSKKFLEENDWNFRKEKLLTNVRYDY